LPHLRLRDPLHGGGRSLLIHGGPLPPPCRRVTNPGPNAARSPGRKRWPWAVHVLGWDDDAVLRSEAPIRPPSESCRGPAGARLTSSAGRGHERHVTRRCDSDVASPHGTGPPSAGRVRRRWGGRGSPMQRGRAERGRMSPGRAGGTKQRRADNRRTSLASDEASCRKFGAREFYTTAVDFLFCDFGLQFVHFFCDSDCESVREAPARPACLIGGRVTRSRP